MPTWYSIKNRLEAGEVKARNEFERFLTGFVTSYGCIDVWYNNIESLDNIITCRLYYIQKDDAFTANALGRPLESWERNQERPEYWLQLRGTVAELRASIISLLPRISQLHNKKIHGEWNFGATQPYEGQGSIVTVDPNNGNIIITGRFGDIVLNNNGEELDWEDIVWSFSGCDPTATSPPGSEVCFTDLGSAVRTCRPTVVGDPQGTCVCGTCCQGYQVNYPVSASDCSCSNPNSAWISGQDLTNELSTYWFDYFNCAPCPGTCVTGSCSLGYTDNYPVTNSNCTGTWFGGRDLSGQTSAYWRTYFGCLDDNPVLVPGCCVIGDACNNYQVSVTLESICAANAAAANLPYTWTEGNIGQNGTCSLEGVLTANNCDDNNRVTITASFAYTTGTHYQPCFIFNPGGENEALSAPFWGDVTIPAITPGSAHTAPDFYNLGDCSTANPAFGCVQNTVSGVFTTYSEWSLTGWSNSAGVANGTVSNTFVFKRKSGQDSKDTLLEYELESPDLISVPYLEQKNENLVTYSSTCGPPCITGNQTKFDLQWTNTGKSTLASVLSSNLLRFRNGNDVSYDGSILMNIPGTGNVVFNFETSGNPSPFELSGPDNLDCSSSPPTAGSVSLNTKFNITFVSPAGEGTETTEWGDNLNSVPYTSGGAFGFIPIQAFKTVVAVSEGA
tara:strand:- start:2808 stop:4829 length:2022 start_codon:yes stop_codon:yes gene_type:complete